MIDFNNVGNAGLMIQYEDIISLSGYNVLKRFRGRNINTRLDQMTDKDLLLMYMNRDGYDVSKWIHDEFHLDVNSNMNSEAMWEPNMLYAYKMFDTAYKNGIKTLMVYSDQYNPAIKTHLKSFRIPIEYYHGDLVPVLREHPNITFTTSSPFSVDACLQSNVPFVLTIVDDFMYVADMIQRKVDDRLRAKNILTFYTSIISAGIVGCQP